MPFRVLSVAEQREEKYPAHPGSGFSSLIAIEHLQNGDSNISFFGEGIRVAKSLIGYPAHYSR